MKLQYTAFPAYCLANGLPEPIPEFVFHAGRKWAFDFAWVDPHRIALELDGGLFGRGKPCPLCGRRRVGAHSSISQQLKDREKGNAAVIDGWRVLHVTPQEFESGEVIEVLRQVF